MSTSARTKPVSLAERREARRKNMPSALTQEQLRKRAVDRMRHNLAHLSEDLYDDAKRWIEMIEIVDGPRAAFDSYMKLLEFAVPKLSRAEVAVEETKRDGTRDMTMDELQDLVMRGIRAHEAEERTIEGEVEDADYSDD